MHITKFTFIGFLAVFGSAFVQGCSDGWRVFGTKCYYFSSLTAPYFGAASYCRAMGSKLAEPSSLDEISFVRNTTKQLRHNFYIGVVDFIVEKRWMFLSSREPVEQTDWAANEPDTRGGIEEDCAETGAYHGQWADVQCSTSRNFICQMDDIDGFGGQIIG